MIVVVAAVEAAEADSEVAATSVAEVAATSTATVAPDTAAAEAGRTTGETTERGPTVVTESERSDRAEQRTNELIQSQDARERRRSECTHMPSHHHHTAITAVNRTCNYRRCPLRV